MAEQRLLTPEGKAKLVEELEHLRNVRRPEVARRIHEAKEFGGDLSDNGEFDEAKQEQAFIEGRILEIEQILREAIVVGHHATSRVDLGATVVVEDEQGRQETFIIVGSAEADPLEGRISNESPVGRALMGHQVGDKVTVTVPSGTLHYIIREVR
jgi:transcription elongation factor GreA